MTHSGLQVLPPSKNTAKNLGSTPSALALTNFQWKPNDRIVLEKNEDYWDQGKPKLQKIIFRAIPENSARLNALKTGEIDLMDGVNPSDIESIKADANLKIFERPSMNVGYLGMTRRESHLTISWSARR